jgi:hypothetical protein
MKTQDIKNIASAYKQVQEKAKMDPVNPDELKGTHAQRKDKDINNDGKVDDTDEYLHNRRKAVKQAMSKEAKEYGPGHIGAVQKMLDKERDAKKAMKKEEVEELDELSKKTLGSYVKKASGNMAGNAAVGAAQASSSMKQSSPEVKRNIANRMKGIAKATDKLTKEDTDMSMKEKLQLQKESILEREMTDAETKKREDIVKGMKKNKADLEKRYGSRWKDVMYATATKQAMESVDDALKMTKNLLTTKESFKTKTTNWPVYARIKENRDMHYKGAAPGDPKMMDKMTASDKAFIAVHNANDLDGIDSGIDGAKAAEYTAKNATTGIKPGAGMNRTGDQKTGDTNIIKSTEAK